MCQIQIKKAKENGRTCKQSLHAWHARACKDIRGYAGYTGLYSEKGRVDCIAGYGYKKLYIPV